MTAPPKAVRTQPNPSLRLSEPDEGASQGREHPGALSEGIAPPRAPPRRCGPTRRAARCSARAICTTASSSSRRGRCVLRRASGREITLAYWSPWAISSAAGNVRRHVPCGRPGGAPYPGAACARRRTRRLMERIPRLAVALWSRRWSARARPIPIHMGTRSAAERLAQLLLLIADLDGRRTPERASSSAAP